MSEQTGQASSGNAETPFLQALSGKKTIRPPVWMMRQAGRYLPEYRELRAKAGSFLDLCYNPEMAAEATLQPIHRFQMDAAILFSDILVVPDALGQAVSFAEGEGPRLPPLSPENDLRELQDTLDSRRLAPVYEAARIVRGKLPPEVALIGFCGAPWTVASYMIAGKSTPDQAPARVLAYTHPLYFERLIDRLVDASIVHLISQIDAGADAVQIFESFAGALPPALFRRWSLEPIGRIAAAIRRERPHARIIVFARGAGLEGARQIAEAGMANAVGLDWSIDPWQARTHVQPHLPVQGNLDPLALLAGGEALDNAVKDILAAFGDGAHIFNLGHGILPATPIAHVERMLSLVRHHAA